MDYGHELEFGTFVTPAAAAPEGIVRLAELADARGIKLTQSNVDTGAGQQQQQQRAATPHQPSAPARARAGTATAADTDFTDTRLA